MIAKYPPASRPTANGRSRWACCGAPVVDPWSHPECAPPTAAAPRVVASAPATKSIAAATRCILGHPHDSKGEATACPIVHARAAHLGLTTFRPGRPGMPCFRVAADDNGRPVYVSVDWVLVDAAGRVALLVDYKGAVAKSKRLDKGWARGKRIVESEYGVRVVELTTPQEANEMEYRPVGREEVRRA